MKLLIVIYLPFIFLVTSCGKEEPTSVNITDVRYEITGSQGMVQITYLVEHFYKESTAFLPWKYSFKPTSLYGIYIRATRYGDDTRLEPPSITVTVYVNEKFYKTASAVGHNASIKVGGHDLYEE